MKTVYTPKSKYPTKPQLPSALFPFKQYPDIESFTITDGPPYANGEIHLGHALNKLLKDTVLKAKHVFQGSKPLIPVWDCHGLPIEWAVEQNFRKDKLEVTKESLLSGCHSFAHSWVKTQSEQFKKLGIDMLSKPVTTMDNAHEIMAVFHDSKVLDRLYSAKRPVMWSHVERTSLADAETDEIETDVDTLWCMFPVVGKDNTFVLVWTTTPWSLPANMAISFSEDIEYAEYQKDGCKYYIAKKLSEEFLGDFVRDISSEELSNTTVLHPLKEFTGERPLLPAEYVNDSTGSGFVHVGPAHDVNDWALWGNKPFSEPLLPNGKFTDDTPLVGGMNAVKGKKFGDGNQAIIDCVVGANRGWVVSKKLTLPYSWRSGALLVPMATRQWFLGVQDLKEPMIAKLEEIPFYPPTARNRIVGMVSSRPDWLISRQRVWGTPMGLLIDEDGNVLRDEEVLESIRRIVEDNGLIGWLQATPLDILEDTEYDHTKYTKVDDILDVWFDSACVQEITEEYPDMVIEGSDQSRGWFQSSGLVGMMLHNRLPYKSVMTHGFVLDENGKKMAKSGKNGKSPMDVIEKYNADILRLWAISSDALHDIKFSDAAMATHTETFRKIRNTLRYLESVANKGNGEKRIHHFDDIDKYIIERLRNTIQSASDALDEMSLPKYVSVIKEFCINDLSQFYFEARKDILYCGTEHERLNIGACMAIVYRNISVLCYPIIPFAVTEFKGNKAPMLNLHIPEGIAAPVNDWEKIKKFRNKVNAMLETHGGNKLAATIVVPSNYVAPYFVYGVSQVLCSTDVITEPYVVEMDGYDKCERCWRHLPVNEEMLCERCEKV